MKEQLAKRQFLNLREFIPYRTLEWKQLVLLVDCRYFEQNKRKTPFE